MPGERRNLRSSKDTSSSTNGEKARSNSQSSSAKDKPVPTRAPSKGKAQPAKKATKDAAGDKPQPNGEPIENGIHETEDVDMVDDGPEKVKAGDHKGEDEMTVVVPPPKSSKLAGDGPDSQDQTAMEGVEETEKQSSEAEKIDPKVKAITGLLCLHPLSAVFAKNANLIRSSLDIKGNFVLLEQAVSQFDARFTLRVLRSMSSVRKHLSPDVLAQVITETYTPSNTIAKALLSTLGKENVTFPGPELKTEMDVDPPREKAPASAKSTSLPKDPLPEVDVYLSILVQIYLYDSHAIESGTKFSSEVVDHLKTLNRRTLDALAARVYFYYSLFYEQLAPLPPSPLASIVSIRPNLLGALRTSVLRKDQDTHATVTTLLLRNYLLLSHITQADLLISHSQFPPAAPNNQIARYLYYFGKIRAIQLAYTEAHEHLTGATRKSPASPSAGGFYQAASKLLVVVELLMGDIPDRAIFRQPSLENAMAPYLSLVQAVRVGKIEGFLNVVQTHSALFRRDGTFTLILRLRQNVIKTGIRMMSLSYAKISLRDICLKLDLESEESAEYIVAKAIRDGVIEATLDHEHGYMKSKDSGDIYATREPGDAFHDRIRACLGLHDESVKVK